MLSNWQKLSGKNHSYLVSRAGLQRSHSDEYASSKNVPYATALHLLHFSPNLPMPDSYLPIHCLCNYLLHHNLSDRFLNACFCGNYVWANSHTTPYTSRRRYFRTCNAMQFPIVSVCPTSAASLSHWCWITLHKLELVLKNLHCIFLLYFSIFRKFLFFFKYYKIYSFAWFCINYILHKGFFF